jgi:glycosyltransferase involved in cell wall biosynthesis
VKLLHVGWGFRPFRYGGLIQYVEDLMAAQVERGHEVAYFCAARHYPVLRGPRLRRWKRDGVRMYEVTNSTLPLGGQRGTPDPLAELDHPPTERLFERALDAFAPDVVHVHELLGLPSSLFGLAQRRGIPVLMTLQDYFPLCPTIKLWDAEQQVCERLTPGEMCAVCCRDAPTDHSEFVRATLLYHQDRLLEAGLDRIPRPEKLVKLFRRAESKVHGADAPSPSTAGSPRDYDRRRAVNVERLSDANLLIAMSTRVAQMYAERGVDPATIRTMQLTLRHIEHIRPKRIERIDGPVRFVTVAGFGNTMKGGDVLFEAMQRLEADGFSRDDLVLHVYGYVEDKYDLSALALVEVEGYYAPDEMDAVLEPFHAGVMPSVWEEAYGYVGVELLAKGLPVLANAAGGMTDYVRDGETGWLNRERGGAGLAAIMADIARRPEQVPELNARVLSDRDSLIKPFGAHADEMDAVYAELAA